MNEKIFISYSRKDKDVVFAMKDEIEKRVGSGNCWIDLTGIESDKQFEDIIISAIDRAEIFLFAYSKNSAASEWTRKEVSFAKIKGKRLVFVNIDGSELSNWFLFNYSGHNIIDYANPDQRNHMLSDLAAWCGTAYDSMDIEGTVLKNCLKNVQGHVEIPAGVTEIGNGAFEDCVGITDITIPESVTKIGNGAFQRCAGLTRIVIPEGVTEIGVEAFFGCTGLTNIVLSKELLEIGWCALRGCTGLENIVVAEGNENYCAENGILFNKDKTEIVSAPAAKGNFVVPQGVTKIGAFAFSDCNDLTSITIPMNLNLAMFGFHAFSGVDKNRCTIYVPKGKRTFFERMRELRDFNIEEV